jgi:D-serine deaminase-like pyridoxal phosphate-dependent protein
MAKRTYPNNYFVWYNDDIRLAILALDTEATASEQTKEAYDTWQGTGNLSGIIGAATRSGTTAEYTTTATHGLEVGDRVTISGTTAYNDAQLASQAITAINAGANTFQMTLSASSGGTETGLAAPWTSLFIEDGLRITYHSKYEDVTTSNLTSELNSTHGVDTGMQNALLCYVKARLYEDQGDMQKAQYFRAMYNKQVKQYPSRKSGVRQLAVPRL